ncbi:MAG: hypothetical protein JO094_10970 [Hyphomicrobiales bacterium]|nr:hypothetical protein [Hyphomicrobiales bacterium]MBV8769403.1 hypothetical protein [Hyphomicrobiales bacterium]MBV9050803.1 hypothetical protein [Hyphomicrobiales bacterium]MBV9977528.1 hypothetical protein [Hyphomicrobiales bacterium]
MGRLKVAQTLKAALVATVLSAVSLTNGVGEAFAGVPTAAAVAPALSASDQASPAIPVYWHGRYWHGGWGWHRGWHRGWGPGWGWGAPVVYGGCWRWRPTPWGPRRVWVC